MPLEKMQVTRRALSLGARDPVSGWCQKTWTETTIEGVLATRSSPQQATAIGTYVRDDALFVGQDGVAVGDELLDVNGTYWEVTSNREVFVGSSFRQRECDLHELPSHADVTVTSSGAFRTDDPRYRTKLYFDTYWIPNNTENDVGGAFATIFMWDLPDYPLTKELRLPSATDLIISLSKQSGRPLIGHDHSPYGYLDHVGLAMYCMNKPNLTASKAVWQAESEIRRILDAYPLGSNRVFDTSRPLSHVFGSNILYGQEYRLSYRRDLTV